MIRHPVFLSLSPNTQLDDLLLTLAVFVTPWRWRGGDAIAHVEQWFAAYLKSNDAVTFNSGRSALLGILQSFGIGTGDEVLVQAFTCVAVPNCVLWAGARPVYVDIDTTLNIDPSDMEKKITNKTRALIVQHTFGIPAQLDRLLIVARKHNLILIEDCAHSLGATYRGKPVGTHGHASFFSFGRDKVLSSVYGGLSTIADRYPRVQKKLRTYQESLQFPPSGWILRQLIYPLACSLITHAYAIGIGKFFHTVLRSLGVMSKAVTESELRGQRPTEFPSRYPNALALLLLNQLRKLTAFNARRSRVSEFYRSQVRTRGLSFLPHVAGAIFLRYPVIVRSPSLLIQRAQRSGVFLGRWYQNVIDPPGVDFASIGYRRGMCPNAEGIAKHIVNLPTNIPRNIADRVIRAI